MRRGNRMTALVLAGVMTVSVVAGCSGGEKKAGQDGASGQNGTAQAAGNEGAKGEAEENGQLPDVEAWYTNNGFLEVKKDGPLYNFYKDLIGVGVVSPYVEWNGGTTYQEQLNLRIAAGEMPDMFLPVNGMESDLAKNGALLDLTDLLPEKAPHLWESVPEEVWDVMRSYDPKGEGRIYMTPNMVDYPQMCGIIRQDWLDALNLQMPTTQEEFVEVLRAFKTQDPNGNGQEDELPTGGRAEARWMDHLFAMYGVAMHEGNPQFDLYDGELVYSGVTQNMRDALEFISGLYKEGLLDPETLLNDKAAWDGKIDSNRVGIYYHWAQSSWEHATAMNNALGIKPEWAVMPIVSAPGYEGFYTMKKVKGVQWVVANTDDEAKIDAVMKVLDAYGNPEYRKALFLGVEGVHSELVDGVLRKLPDDKKTQENLVLQPFNDIATVDSTVSMLEDVKSQDTAWAYDRSIENVKENVKYGKRIAGDGMPNSVYDGYADIMNRTLYAEYASKIIAGEYPIEKFDEFVERWYASGGEQVTQAARDWYAKTQN